MAIFLEKKGIHFSTSTDTEVLVQFISFLYKDSPFFINLFLFETERLKLVVFLHFLIS